MGFDVSFHPISPKEMEEWYFTPLEWVRQGQEQRVLDLAVRYGLEDFYAQKYLDTLRVGARTADEELFDKSHGFYLAVVQGFFRTYYYTRGSAFTFLLADKPAYLRYVTPWQAVTPRPFRNPVANAIVENYCAGVYLAPQQVRQLLRDLADDEAVRADFEALWSDGQLAVLQKALQAAEQAGAGLLEATEVVEPNPFSLNDSGCYSNLYNCDTEGVLLFRDVASKQLAEAMQRK